MWYVLQLYLRVIIPKYLYVINDPPAKRLNKRSLLLLLLLLLSHSVTGLNSTRWRKTSCWSGADYFCVSTMVPFRGLLYMQERNNLYRFSALPRQFYKRSSCWSGWTVDCEQPYTKFYPSHFSFESRRSRTHDLRAWQWGIDYEYCPPFFLKNSRASETQARVAFSRVGWFSRALAFRSLYYPWGKMGDYS